MNVMGMQMACSVCNGIKRFKQNVNDAKRIRSRIESLLPDRNVSIAKVNNVQVRTLMNEHKYSHFMCGVCRNANENDLIMEEMKITEALIKFLACAHRDAEKDIERYIKIYYEIQCVLRGDYPKLARNLEQYWFKNFKKEKSVE